MKKHFFKRLLTVIIAFIAIFFFVVFLTRQSEGDAMSKGMSKAFLVLFFYIFLYRCCCFRADFGFNNSV